MSVVLEVRDVHKKYWRKKALDGVSITVERGKIVGLLGSNGSGKTTLMKLIAGLAQPSSGTIRVAGASVGCETKRVVSYMPDVPLTESWMRVKDAIAFQRDFYTDFDDAKASEMIEFMKLNKHDRVNGLSKGMQERLQLTMALSRNASLYLFDEPIGGVDPVARGKILDAIVEYYSPESSIILTTHLLKDIERIFDEVILLKEGRLLMQEEVETIRMRRGIGVDELFKEVYAEC
ncbi:ABC transporter ATP-binding protein [Paenibacillus septentrionalis]|uniref:ABC transporter ATP-binding protein n=1 Tax=Paenibacillus septentrionalis TaxID=429342 RepID=A0ABW1VAY8_9BACL